MSFLSPMPSPDKGAHLPLPKLAMGELASYPGSNYAGEGRRAWYLPFAVASTAIMRARSYDR